MFSLKEIPDSAGEDTFEKAPLLNFPIVLLSLTMLTQAFFFQKTFYQNNAPDNPNYGFDLIFYYVL